MLWRAPKHRRAILGRRRNKRTAGGVLLLLSGERGAPQSKIAAFIRATTPAVCASDRWA